MTESPLPNYPLKPIGFMQTCFPRKNGTPRQSNICSSSRGVLKISRELFSNPEHSLCGIESFSHVWVMFIFHLNKNKGCKAKVKPPRLDGAKVGVFASRTPHRPNQIGLTLAKLDHVKGDELYVSGIDIVDGTPIVDIKPYIPMYDVAKIDTIATKPNTTFNCLPPEEKEPSSELQEEKEVVSTELPQRLTHDEVVDASSSTTVSNQESNDITHEVSTSENGVLEVDDALKNGNINNISSTILQNNNNNSAVDIPEWLEKKKSCMLDIMFTERALQNIEDICSATKEQNGLEENNLIKSYCEKTMCSSPKDLRKAITEILQEDPRSTYRKVKCADKLYFFLVGPVYVPVWFDKLDKAAISESETAIAEVLKVERYNSGSPYL